MREQRKIQRKLQHSHEHTNISQACCFFGINKNEFTQSAVHRKEGGDILIFFTFQSFYFIFTFFTAFYSSLVFFTKLHEQKSNLHTTIL